MASKNQSVMAITLFDVSNARRKGIIQALYTQMHRRKELHISKNREPGRIMDDVSSGADFDLIALSIAVSDVSRKHLECSAKLRLARLFFVLLLTTRLARSIFTCCCPTIAVLKSSLLNDKHSTYVQAFTVAPLKVDPSKQLSPKKSFVDKIVRGAETAEEVLTSTKPDLIKYSSIPRSPSLGTRS